MQNLFSPSIFLDTSVVHGANADSAPFQLLVSLAAAGLLKIYFPELVKDEFRTQWRDASEKHLSQALKALTQLKTEHFLKPEIRQIASDLIASLESINVEAESTIFSANFVTKNCIDVHPLNQSQAQLAWSGYFSGKLPSKKIKHRPDIPDAHVMASVSDFSKSAISVYFVSQDKSLLESIGSDRSIRCFPNLDDLLNSDELLELRSAWEREKRWRAVRDAIDYDEVMEAVENYVLQHGGELLSWKEVRARSIPEDNHTANIEMYGEPEDIELGNVEDWGGGLLRYGVSYLSECLIGFKVLRADAYDVPEWVSVSYGDPELDHYFDAEADVVVRVAVDVNVRIEIDDASGETKLGDIGFEEGSIELELTMDEK
jgi:PIN domain